MGQQSLEAVNQRLKAGRVGVTVRRRGNRLALRATLPPKPGSGKDRPHQQDISLGIYANPKGLERAEDEAKKLGVQLTQKEFDWGNWGMPRPPTPKTSRDWVESFKTSYFRTHQLSESTWQKHWQTYFNRLPLERPLTGTLLVAVALSTSENTRARKECCKKFQKLADFAGVDCDLIQYQGRYSTGRNACPRELPPDEDIATWFSKIRYRPWAWVYGMLAAYGLRPHEAWFCEFVEGNHQQALQVTEGKTGPRLVYPLYPEWVQRWGLEKISRPQVTVPIKDDGTRDYDEYGRRACRQFTRYEIPFLPYDLRHAYGVRGSVKFGPAHGLTVPTMAAWMGHSPTVHLNLYNRWISDAQHQQQYQQFLDQTDRPSAP